MNHSFSIRVCRVAVFLPSAFVTVALGGGFDGTVDPIASSATINGTVQIHNTGVLIGDYDAATNPTGTRTLPGLFGGSGNNEIDIELTGAISTDLNTNPTGAMQIDLDINALTIDLTGLVLDVLGGQNGAAQPSVAMLFSTFRTVNPSFLYFGGVPFEVPIGSGASIDTATVTQTGDGIGVLTATVDPDVFDFAMVMPADLMMEFTLGLDGVAPPTGGTPTPIVLPLNGSVEMLGDGTVVLTMNIDTQQINQETPIAGVSSPQIPFELPTFGTETAGVLMTLTPDLLSTDISYTWSLTINGVPMACAADLTGDGVLNIFDVFAFLDAFNAGDAAADLTDDGVLNIFDFFAYLDLFNAGCP